MNIKFQILNFDFFTKRVFNIAIKFPLVTLFMIYFFKILFIIQLPDYQEKFVERLNHFTLKRLPILNCLRGDTQTKHLQAPKLGDLINIVNKLQTNSNLLQHVQLTDDENLKVIVPLSNIYNSHRMFHYLSCKLQHLLYSLYHPFCEIKQGITPKKASLGTAIVDH